MKTEDIRDIRSYIERNVGLSPGSEMGQDVALAKLAALETSNAVKDKALQQAALRFELLAIAGIGMTNGVDPMAGVKDCHAALSTEPTGKVVVDKEEIQAKFDEWTATCPPGLAPVSFYYALVDEMRSWLDAKIKEAEDA